MLNARVNLNCLLGKGTCALAGGFVEASVAYFFRNHSHSFLMPITAAERTPVFIRKLTSAITITGSRSTADSCLKAEKSPFSRLIAIKTSATANRIHLFFHSSFWV